MDLISKLYQQVGSGIFGLVKGIHVLLESFGQIARQFLDARVNLVGGVGSLARDRLVGITQEKQVSDLDRSYSGSEYISALKSMLPPDLEGRVQFRGSVHYSKVIDYYQNSAILVNPALSEPFGRSLVEANACGVPIVAARVGGMAKLIEHGKNGLLVEQGDAGELTEAVVSLLYDDHRRSTMGAAGRKFVVDHFSWDRINADLNSQYQRLLAA